MSILSHSFLKSCDIIDIKMKLLLILIFIPTISFAECYYKMIEQDGTYYVIRKVIGELPKDGQELKSQLAPKLRMGLNNVEVTNKDKKNNKSNVERESRVQVEYMSKDKKQAEAIFKKYCPF